MLLIFRIPALEFRGAIVKENERPGIEVAEINGDGLVFVEPVFLELGSVGFQLAYDLLVKFQSLCSVDFLGQIYEFFEFQGVVLEHEFVLVDGIFFCVSELVHFGLLFGSRNFLEDLP